ncbi:hypothetical protein GCM10007891_16760 [Methylophaga thalassica]|uniref:Glycosyltransferase 2-like domain-containing protein n=1 Tax=Methylophaga thalassica TaxID=40223 RepID=A0ABQ5TWJ0_9GAMM|nr:glycosyltransferase family 2 protein [Methylophaga thalassica]GLP99822.1 hypothetical protein GCM10007891_16760 [Methylophaga thalassica]
MHNSPLVSIIIPCYNREKYIRDAIDSCLRQTYPNIEIIVVDDGSKDNSVDVVKTYKDKVKLIVQQNGGVSVARNTGLKASNGEFLIFLDSDDWISDDLVKEHVKTFQKWPEIDITCANSKSIMPDGSESKVNDCNWPNHPDNPKELFLLSPPPFPACEMYRASKVKSLGGFYEDMRAFADSSVRIRIVLDNGKVARTDGGYAIYRPVENSITRNKTKLHFYAIKLLKKLKSEYSDNQEISILLNKRLKKHRVRYWLSNFSHHLSLHPISILKLIRHLFIVSKIDPGYIFFIIKEKPWLLDKKDSF